MGFFGLALVLFFIFVIVWPLLRMWQIMGNVKKRQQEIYRQMFGDQDNDNPISSQQRRKAGWDKPDAKRRKKIAPTVGEYVRFQEVDTPPSATAADASAAASAGAQTAADTHSTSESQIEDIDWVDLPPSK